MIVVDARLQWYSCLKSQGYDVAINGQILELPVHKHTPPNQLILKVSEDYFDEIETPPEKILKIRDPRAIWKYGVCLISERDQTVYDKKPVLYYKVAGYPHKNMVEVLTYGRHAFEPYFECDEQKRRIRFIGVGAWPNDRCTEWYYFDKQEQRSKERRRLKRKLEIGNYLAKPLQYLSDLIKLRNKIPIVQHHDVPLDRLVPIGYTAKGEIICLPLGKDEPTIVIAGTKGRGKSLLADTITDVVSLYGGRKVIVMNDNVNKSWSRINPSPNKIIVPSNEDQEGKILWVKDQWALFNAPLRGLDAAYFYPSYETEEKDSIIYDGIAGFKFTIPYKEVINDLKKYARITEGSGRTYDAMKSELLKCQTVQEYKETITKWFALCKDKTAPAEMKLPENSIKLLNGEIRSMLDKGLLDLGSKTPSKWTLLKDGKPVLEENPLIVLSYIGIVPFLVTHKIYETNDWPKVFLYIFYTLNKRQKSHPLFQETKYWLIVDEFSSVLYTYDHKGNQVPTAALALSSEIVREGRNNRIGSVFILQNYKDLPEYIQQNATYFITFENKTEGEEFVKTYKCDKSWLKRIPQLKRYEFIIATSDQIILVKPNGKTESTRGPIEGTIYWPLSSHSSPTDTPPT